MHISVAVQKEKHFCVDKFHIALSTSLHWKCPASLDRQDYPLLEGCHIISCLLLLCIYILTGNCERFQASFGPGVIWSHDNIYREPYPKCVHLKLFSIQFQCCRHSPIRRSTDRWLYSFSNYAACWEVYATTPDEAVSLTTSGIFELAGSCNDELTIYCGGGMHYQFPVVDKLL